MKKYIEIKDIFSELFCPYEIVIFWGDRGQGKSSLAGKFMDELMKHKNAKHDVKKCAALCNKLNRDAGFSFTPPEDHLVFCDTSFIKTDKIRGDREAYVFDPIAFGLPNDIHPTDPTVPFGKYFFDEDMELFDSHQTSLATFVSKEFQLGRQLDIFACLCVQRPMDIHKILRDIAVFVECVEKENHYNKYGRLYETVWTCNIIYKNAILEQYLSSRDSKLIDKKVQFVYKGNIYRCYDDHFFLPMFFKGFENVDFKLEKSKRTEISRESFDNFEERRTVDIPDTYRGKKPKEKRK